MSQVSDNYFGVQTVYKITYTLFMDTVTLLESSFGDGVTQCAHTVSVIGVCMHDWACMRDSVCLHALIRGT